MQKGVKALESYKKGGTQEEEKKNDGEKKKSQKLGLLLLLLLWVPQKVSKIFKKTKNKNSLFGVLSFKIKARRPRRL